MIGSQSSFNAQSIALWGKARHPFRHHPSNQVASIMLALLVAITGTVVLIAGWTFKQHYLVHSGANAYAMAPSTALCFVLTGIAIIFWWQKERFATRRIVLGLSILIALIALTDLLVALISDREGVDNYLFDSWYEVSCDALATGLLFLSAAFCLGTLTTPKHWHPRTFDLAASTGLFISSLSIIGHLFNSPTLLVEFWFTSMALHTAVTGALLSFALLLARPDAGWLNLLFDKGSGSTTARRLLPFAILSTLALCILAFAMVEAGAFDPNFRMSLLTMALATMATIAILKNAQIENRAEHDAQQDPLTRLPNRLRFSLDLEDALERADQTGTKVGLLLCDLDGFKTINGVLGPAAGDELLRIVSKRLTSVTGSLDRVARIGGDEFAVIMPGHNNRAEVEESCDTILRAIWQPMTIQGGVLDATTSFGVAIYPDDTTRMHTLIRSAGLALAQAKSAGRRRVCYFNQDLAAAARRRSEIEADLRIAIEKGDLELRFQPQINLATGRIRTAEALVRWRRNGQAYVSPSEFIPVAETSGLIRPLGQWIFSQACAQQARWQTRGYSVKVAVNVSPAQIAYDDFPIFLRQTLEAHGINGRAIEMEITEGLLIEHESPAMKSFLDMCGKLSIGLAIDDFGTGYSSFGYLRRLPISKIKIDRSFIAGLGRDNDDAVVQAMIAVGHGLGKRVVAEGAETTTQLDVLRRLGCDDIQGYLFSPPIPADEVEEKFLCQAPVELSRKQFTGTQRSRSLGTANGRPVAPALPSQGE